jgi:hypothetical protein
MVVIKNSEKNFYFVGIPMQKDREPDPYPDPVPDPNADPEPDP